MKLVKLLNKKHVGLIVMEYGRIKAGDDRWAGYYALVLQGVWKKEIEEAIKGVKSDIPWRKHEVRRRKRGYTHIREKVAELN